VRAEVTTRLRVVFVTHLSETLEGDRDAGKLRLEPESSQKDEGEEGRVPRDTFPNTVSLTIGALGEPPLMTE
jgi:hypothetical protein